MSQLICKANQLTGFCLRAALELTGLSMLNITCVHQKRFLKHEKCLFLDLAIH